MTSTRKVTSALIGSLLVIAPMFPQMPAPVGIQRYTYQGIHLGMSLKEAQTVAKTLANGKIGGDHDAIQFDSHRTHIVISLSDGIVTHYSVCGLDNVQNGAEHGPIYDLAVKTFGLGATYHSDLSEMQWPKVGGVWALYQWDDQQNTSGCIEVAPAGHRF